MPVLMRQCALACTAYARADAPTRPCPPLLPLQVGFSAHSQPHIRATRLALDAAPVSTLPGGATISAPRLTAAGTSAAALALAAATLAISAASKGAAALAAAAALARAAAALSALAPDQSAARVAAASACHTFANTAVSLPPGLADHPGVQQPRHPLQRQLLSRRGQALQGGLHE